MIKLEINIEQLKSEELKIHYIPAKIDSNVTANVDTYFNSYTREEKGGFLSNALRGYRKAFILFFVKSRNLEFL